MKREYETPEIEIVSFLLNGVCSDIIHHSANESGGKNSGWDFNDNNDDDFGDLP